MRLLLNVLAVSCGLLTGLVCLLIAQNTTFAQTAIVLKKTREAIFVGADSKVTDPAGGGELDKEEKIIQLAPNRYVAVAGITGYAGDPSAPSFDTYALAKACAETSPFNDRNMREMVDRCTKDIARNILLSLRAYKEREPKIYQSRLVGKPIQFAFFGHEGGSLVLYSREFRPPPEISGREVSDPPIRASNCEGTCIGHTTYGWHDNIDAALAKDPANWGTDIPLTICRLIQLEIKAHPSEVGWPVKVLRINKDGSIERLSFQRACENKSRSPKRRG
ncbi:MAG TPA: hypothetical protein VGQ39_02415 [Pyrinomonadaceae bacterium]|nr:hypothetical protein [Pyrinomonadaceae bacterium]